MGIRNRGTQGGGPRKPIANVLRNILTPVPQASQEAWPRQEWDRVRWDKAPAASPLSPCQVREGRASVSARGRAKELTPSVCTDATN